MAICTNCGTQVQDGIAFCPNCSVSLSAAPAPQPQYQQPPQQPQYQQPPPPPQYQPPPAQPPQYQQAPPPPQPQYQQLPQQPPQYQQAPPQQQYQQQPPPQQQYQQPGYPPPPGYTPPVVPGAAPYDYVRDTQENKTMAILSYLLFFVPLLTGAHKTSPFVKHHVNQGTVIWIGSVGYSIISAILSAVIKVRRYWGWGYVSVTPSWLTILLWLISVPIFILAVMGIINAATGKTKELPVIGKIVLFK